MTDIIEIEKGKKYLSTAKKVSDYLSGLPLTAKQNDKLVQLMLEHVSAGRKEAYAQGFKDAYNPDIACSFTMEIQKQKSASC